MIYNKKSWVERFNKEKEGEYQSLTSVESDDERREGEVQLGSDIEDNDYFQNLVEGGNAKKINDFLRRHSGSFSTSSFDMSY